MDGNTDAKPDPSRARAWFAKPLEVLRAMAEAAKAANADGQKYEQPPSAPSGVTD